MRRRFRSTSIARVPSLVALLDLAPFSFALRSVSLVLLSLAVSASIATAQYVEPVWGPEEIVDTGSIDITSSTGSGILHTPDWAPWASLDEWHVVYAKAGDIYHAVRTSAGWQAPEQLTADAAISKDPKLAFIRNRLVVIWEDDRRGHPEIWSREWYAGAWGAEIGLADDAIPSRGAVVTGWESKGFAAWEEGEDGATHIAGRGYTATGWGAVEAVSTGLGAGDRAFGQLQRGNGLSHRRVGGRAKWRLRDLHQRASLGRVAEPDPAHESGWRLADGRP